MGSLNDLGFANFPSNNGKTEKKETVEKKPKPKAVVNGKKSLSNFNIINSNEGPKQVSANIASKILVPSIKKTIKEIGEAILNVLFGNGKASSSSSNFASSLGATFTPYAGLFGQSTNVDTFGNNINNMNFQSIPDWNNITYGSAEDCDAVLKSMFADACKYHFVSILDLYDYSGIPCSQTTFAGYGWKPEHFQEASYKETLTGRYKITLPKPVPIR